MTRRGLLNAGVLLSAAAKASGPMPRSEAARAVEAAHTEIWKRFLDKHGIFYDYAGLKGEVLTPTPEECRDSKPNALGWWCPIENGAFFGGLYLEAQCNRWKVLRTREAARKASIIAGGLERLAKVGKTPGFVARGVSTDGESHHIAGSDDQTLPWFYGLWRYVKSGLPAPARRDAAIRLMDHTARALHGYGWRMPCDRVGFGFRGAWTEANFIHAARLLFVTRAMHELTGREEWLEEYRRRLREKPADSELDRLEHCAAGAQYEGPGSRHRYPINPPFWTSASAQAGLRALAGMETDPGIRERFQEGLDRNARGAAAHIARYREFDNDANPGFDPDWRFLNGLWRPQAVIADAVGLAQQQLPEWNKKSPRRTLEASHMREPLFAAWVTVLSGNPEIVAAAMPDIEGALRHYRWAGLYTSLFFIAECVQYPSA